MSSSRSRPLALITGASSGIGATFAERLARDGYDLILVARRRDRLEALAARLRDEAGAEAEPLAADLADAEALSQVEAQVAGDERLALLVNNAGFGGYRPFVEVEPKIVDELIAVHVRAVTRLTRAALPGMVRRGKGAVINIASLLALSGALPPNPLPYRAVYAGAKAFILAFTEALSGELGQSGVRVQACLPGLVDTEYHAVAGRDLSKMPPMMHAADVVAASLAALSHAEVVCVPGLDDASLLERLADVRRTVLMSANRPALAQRYRSSIETIMPASSASPKWRIRTLSRQSDRRVASHREKLFRTVPEVWLNPVRSTRYILEERCQRDHQCDRDFEPVGQ